MVVKPGKPGRDRRENQRWTGDNHRTCPISGDLPSNSLQTNILQGVGAGQSASQRRFVQLGSLTSSGQLHAFPIPLHFALEKCRGASVAGYHRPGRMVRILTISLRVETGYFPQHRSFEWRGMAPRTPKDGKFGYVRPEQAVFGNRTAFAVLRVLVLYTPTTPSTPAWSPVAVLAIRRLKGLKGIKGRSDSVAPLGPSAIVPRSFARETWRRPRCRKGSFRTFYILPGYCRTLRSDCCEVRRLFTVKSCRQLWRYVDWPDP
jgi:hypothetical protein